MYYVVGYFILQWKESDLSLNLSSHSCVTLAKLTEKEKLEQNYLCWVRRTQHIVTQILIFTKLN